MSLSKFARPRAVLAGLATAPSLQCFAGRQIRWESTEQKAPTPEEAGGRSFKGQLYESTSTRLQKERIERARHAKERDEGASGRNWSFTFGTSSPFSPSFFVPARSTSANGLVQQLC